MPSTEFYLLQKTIYDTRVPIQGEKFKKALQMNEVCDFEKVVEVPPVKSM